MIYTITPNPALDLGGVVDEIVPDEKNYVHDETRSPGGNGINVARILTSLSTPVLATGFLGGGPGHEIRFLLDQEKVPHQFIEILGHTRTSVTVSNRKSHRQTRLSFPGPTLQSHEMNRLFQWVKDQKQAFAYVIGGSLPGQFSNSSLQELIEVTKTKAKLVGVDVPGKILKDAIRANPSFIKPNLTEFQELVGKPVQTRAEVLHAAQDLLSHVPLICISSVEDGALLVTKESSWYVCGPKIHVKSTVGAGDSMVGAIFSKFWEFQDQYPKYLGEIFKWGLAAAMATLSHPGTRLGNKSEMEFFYPQIRLESVK
jgi:1-phosphofructokinase family hexose kinase